MEKTMYTKEQVHQVVEEVLLALGISFAPTQGQTHLDNDIPLNTSPEDVKMTLTVPEAARLLGISKPKMYELVHAGKFRTVKVGKKILISRQSLQDWIEKGENNGKEAC